MGFEPLHIKDKDMETKKNRDNESSCKIYHPIHRGRIERIFPESGYGMINADSGEEVSFIIESTNLNRIKVGVNVVFTMYPTKSFYNRYYAKHVRIIYRSRDNYIVADRPKSHVHCDLTKRLQYIIGNVSCDGHNHVYQVIQFPHKIGYLNCVKVDWRDEIVYAKREGRDYYSKFVKNREPQQSNFVTLILDKVQGIYLIKSCFTGNMPEMEPDLENKNNFHKPFWQDHALIYGKEPIVPETETSINPWSGINENRKIGANAKIKINK